MGVILFGLYFLSGLGLLFSTRSRQPAACETLLCGLSHDLELDKAKMEDVFCYIGMLP